ncbi:DUF4845 domain-containing protein [Solilutibacter silvestris]|uniref:DUF4845 domain-containing protein n=1 Tax=Solilutibacter silvestris TaxID=1645665 RepID=A0A2K1PZN7_9GAMM|nr:DUF4845 domain-containing protein [Lysobacter silvestris]PNS08251.1 hypothetical protein Lysil_2427 [Lysobacter silvestris]
MKRSQSGLSMMGFLFFLILAGFVAWIVMKIFPMYREYFAIKDAFKGIATTEGNLHDNASIQKSLERRFDIGYVDVAIAKQVHYENQTNSIVIDYERESELVGPFSLKGTFHIDQPLAAKTE